MQNYESTYDLTRIISIDISLIVGLKDLHITDATSEF